MSEVIQGVSFSTVAFACNDVNVKFFSLQFHKLSHTTR